MSLLHQYNYNIDGYFEAVYKTKPMDGSDWGSAEKELFCKLMKETDKDLQKVAKRMKKTVCNCLCYYYGTYKFTADYTQLKKMNRERRLALFDEIDDEESQSTKTCDNCAYDGKPQG